MTTFVMPTSRTAPPHPQHSCADNTHSSSNWRLFNKVLQRIGNSVTSFSRGPFLKSFLCTLRSFRVDSLLCRQSLITIISKYNIRPPVFKARSVLSQAFSCGLQQFTPVRLKIEEENLNSFIHDPVKMNAANLRGNCSCNEGLVSIM